jgi:cytochrome P450
MKSADLMPFAPTPDHRIPLAVIRNFLIAFPLATYEKRFFRKKYPWPLGDIFYVCDPQVIEEFLIRRADEFVRDEATARAFAAELDRGSIFLAEGAEWRWVRRAASPAFRHENLLDFVPIFARNAECRAARLANAPTGDVTDISRLATETTFDIVHDAVLGAPAGFSRVDFLSALETAYKGMQWQRVFAKLGLPGRFPYPDHGAVKRATDYAYNEVAKIVGQRRGGQTDGKDIISLLVHAHDPETGRGLDDQDIAGNLFAFIVAGYETSAAAVAWCLWLLSHHAEAQQRARAEIIAIAGDRAIGPAEVERLSYTRQCAQEALRLFPPVPAVARQPRHETHLGGEFISPKTQVVAPTWSIHRNHLLWDEPSRFDPDRFAPERVKARPRCAWLPFGAGPRICIGMNFAMLEIVTILGVMLRRVRFEPVTNYRLELSTHVTLRAREGLPVRIYPQETSLPRLAS